MLNFACQTIRSWDEYNNAVRDKTTFRPSEGRSWLYRGQTENYPLTTSIERALVRWSIPLADATSIEFQTIREFRRRLRDPEHHRAQEDTLYCLALMQHHGAPTRLLDCTFSPFVAAAFAMENGIFRADGKKPDPQPVVWCFRGQWLEKEAKNKLTTSKAALAVRRNKDAFRNDQTFIPLYQIKTSRRTSPPRWKFVKTENPLHLNERLTTQQGAFLCPADLGSSFEENLKAMDGWDLKDNVLKLLLRLEQKKANTFVQKLKEMNISFAALIPGLDGFARSINQQIRHYHELGQGYSGLG
jgi:FRG domain